MCIVLALLLISCVTVSAFADIEIEILVGGEENPSEGGEEEGEAPVAAAAPAVLSRVVNEDNKYVAHSYETDVSDILAA